MRFVIPVVFYEITSVECVYWSIQLYLLVEYKECNIHLHPVELTGRHTHSTK